MKLLFFTGSRSEWGYIRPLLNLCKREKINFKICATNMLLLDSFGLAKKEIEKDGFKVNEEIFMALDGYNNTTMTKSMGVLLQSFTDTLSREKPTWLLVAGDRGETLIATIAAAYMNIPIAHIQAGELSGNIDGQARHAIGKFAHLHFASNFDAALRLKKLGEQDFRIFNYGAPQLDDLRDDNYVNLNKKYFEKKFNLDFKKNYCISVYHPVVEEEKKNEKMFLNYQKNINNLEINKIWICPNNDSGGNFIKKQIYLKRGADDFVFENLPRHEYLSLLKNSKFIIGNSSSGILESASFKIPCINIGRRQNKRLRAKNVIDIKYLNKKNLRIAINKINSKSFRSMLKKLKNPYGDGFSSKKILQEILNTKINEKLLYKELNY